MSFENTKPEGGLKEELESIPYHSMRGEFEKRGIMDVWKAGTSKKNLVLRALERIGFIKEAKEELGENADSKLIDEIVKQKEVELIEVELEEVQEIQDESDEIVEAQIKELKRKFTLEDGSLDKEAIQKSKEFYEKRLKTNPAVFIKKVEAHDILLK